MDSILILLLCFGVLCFICYAYPFHKRKCEHVNQIIPGIYIGDAISASKEELDAHDIGAVVNCASELSDPDVLLRNIDYLYLPLADSTHQNLKQSARVAIPWITKQRYLNNNVLIHCAMGRSRSVAIFIAYLISICNISPDQALQIVKAKRPCAHPNPGFMKQLQDFYQTRKPV